MQDKKKRALFIDRDGTIVVEPMPSEQVDSYDKLEFLPGAIGCLSFIARTLDYELVMVSNQDGLGTPAFPQEDFEGPHRLILKTLEGEGVKFSDIIIDKTFPEDHQPTRKPGIALLGRYTGGDYDLAASFVIGDRLTDVQLAHNLGAKAIWLNADVEKAKTQAQKAGLTDDLAVVAPNWHRIADFLRAGSRTAHVVRNTAETKIEVSLDLDGTGTAQVATGIGFFDHMLSQIARHSGIDLSVKVDGDLWVDAHHTIEDTGIVLGEAIRQALGDKRGIERYGFMLPMDDCRATVALDFGGRSWLVWDAEFHRELIGQMPTEMFPHFFKSLSDAAQMNLYIKARGDNEHHKIECIFKALARALRQAIKRDPFTYRLPSTKEVL